MVFKKKKHCVTTFNFILTSFVLSFLYSHVNTKWFERDWYFLPILIFSLLPPTNQYSADQDNLQLSINLDGTIPETTLDIVYLRTSKRTKASLKDKRQEWYFEGTNISGLLSRHTKPQTESCLRFRLGYHPDIFDRFLEAPFHGDSMTPSHTTTYYCMISVDILWIIPIINQR